MRWHWLWLVICAGLSTARAAEPLEFPYRAYVASDDVYVRSGPGENYYPALKLQAGDEVEVYRHDPGGWYAIRPPQGSFSWVSAEFVKTDDGALGTIDGERVVARVGTSFGDQRDVIQVRLDRGEEVEILEARRFGTGPAAQTWYKIAPPAGEFRWISGRLLSRDLAAEAPRAEGPRNNLLLARLESGREAIGDPQGSRQGDDSPESVKPMEPAATSADLAAGDGGTNPASDGPRVAGAKAGESAAESQTGARSGGWQKAPPGQRLPAARRASAGPSAVASDPAEEFAAIDLALSATVAGDPEDWTLVELRDRAAALLADAASAVERGRARVLLRKIERFGGIQDRYRQLADVRHETDELNQPLAAMKRTLTARSETIRAESRFDGQGRLTEVDSAKAGAPRFVLLDEAGDVVSYVTPAPGVNLRRFVGQPVGVQGTRGYLIEERAGHVTARRVEPLAGGLLR